MNKPFLGVERVINLEKEQSKENIKIDEIITKTVVTKPVKEKRLE